MVARISPANVVTCLKCGGLFCDKFLTNFLLNVVLKDFKSLHLEKL